MNLEISSRKLEISRTFHAKMGMRKDRNGRDLTEAEHIKKLGDTCSLEEKLSPTKTAY